MTIEDKLSKKDSVFVGVFCLLAVGRLANIYEAFSKRFATPLQDYLAVLEQAYDFVFSSNKDELGDLKTSLEKLIPDTEEYSDVLADQTQCAAIGMMYALEYISDYDSSMVGYVLQKVEESIDILGYEGGDDKGVLAREKEWQSELLEKLSGLSELNRAAIKELEKLNRDYSIPHV